MSNSKTKQVSFPILGILGLIFITLKLAGIGAVANWSWVWVLSPFWIPFAILAVVLAVCAIFAVCLNK